MLAPLRNSHIRLNKTWLQLKDTKEEVGRRCLQSRGQDTHWGPRVLEVPGTLSTSLSAALVSLFIPGTMIVPALVIALARGATGSQWTKGTKFKSFP